MISGELAIQKADKCVATKPISFAGHAELTSLPKTVVFYVTEVKAGLGF